MIVIDFTYDTIPQYWLRFVNSCPSDIKTTLEKDYHAIIFTAGLRNDRIILAFGNEDSHTEFMLRWS